MTMSMTCRRCDVEIAAQTEDELVEQVQKHVADAHPDHEGRMHAVTREKVLGRLRLGHSRRRHDHESPENG